MAQSALHRAARSRRTRRPGSKHDVYCLALVFTSGRGDSRGVGLLKWTKLVTLPEASRTKRIASASLPSLRTRRKTSPPLGFRKLMSEAGSADGKLRCASPPAQGSITDSDPQG